MWKEVEGVLLALFSLSRRDGLRVKIRGLVGEEVSYRLLEKAGGPIE